MDEYYRILESLPPALRTPLAKLDAHYAPHIQEIRLRLGQPVQFTICGRLCPAAKFLPGTGLPAALETDPLRDCFLQLCRRFLRRRRAAAGAVDAQQHSLYAVVLPGLAELAHQRA